MIPQRDRGFRRNHKIGHVQSETPITLLRNDGSRSIGIVGHAVVVNSLATYQQLWERIGYEIRPIEATGRRGIAMPATGFAEE